MSHLSLENQVVLMIGAGRDPGPGLALALAAQGAVVAANDLSPILLDPLCESAQPLPGRIKAYPGEAARGMPLRAMLDEVMEDWGKIDVLINNPRVMPVKPILEMDEWDWQRTIEMNLNGPFLVTQLVARIMREQRRGTILNIIDTNTEPSSPEKAAYAASQSGLLAFSQAAAQEFMAYNIQVGTLCPESGMLTPGEHAPTQPSEGALEKLVIALCSTTWDAPAGLLIRVPNGTSDF